MKKKFPAWIILMIFCLVAAACLAVTNMLTAPVIEVNTAKESMATRLALLPGSAVFEDMENGVSVGKDQNGNVVGYAGIGTANGFGGEVESTVAVYPDGKIAGVSVGGANFAETAGLGARAKEPEFQAQFAGKTTPVSLSKDGGEIDALTGATITSKAVINGVNSAVNEIAAQAGFTVEALPAEPEVTVTDGKYTAKADGFGGPVAVTLELDENNVITSIEIGDKDFNETPGLGAKAQDDAFKGQFIGKTLPVTENDIDMMSGATVTSKAVLSAIEKIAAGKDSAVSVEAAVEEPETEGPETEGPETEEPETEEPAAEGVKTVSASAEGFGGPVAVSLELDENNTIISIEIGDKDFNETPGLGAKAQDDAFKGQFIGKTLPVTENDIDMMSGATVTSKAVLSAIEEINKQIGDAAPAADTPAAEGQYTLYNVTGETLKEVTLTNNDTGDVTVVATDVAADAVIDAIYSAEEGTVLTLAFTTESGYTGHFDTLHIETAPISLLPETLVDAETHPTMIEFKALKLGQYTLYNVTGETLKEITLTNNDSGDVTVVTTDVATDAAVPVMYTAADGTVLTLAFTTESGYTGHFDTLHIETAPISLLPESAVDAETHPTMINFAAPAAE